MELDELGAAIRRARLNKGVTQEQLCNAVRISRTTLSLLENGKLPEIGINKVIEVLAQLGLEFSLREAHARPTLRELKAFNADPAILENTPIRQRASRRTIVMHTKERKR